MILEVDKSHDIVFYPRSVYHEKLLALFSDSSKFEKVLNLDIETEITRFNRMLEDTIQPNLSKKTVKQLSPRHSIMDCYETIELHKEKAPSRPICTEYRSLVAGAETFLTKTFSTLLDDSRYEVYGPKDFKNKVDIENFAYDANIHTVMTLDVQSLFTNVKVGRVVSYLPDEVKKQPQRFFNEIEDGQLLAPPSRIDLRKFLTEVLTDFNFFRTEVGVLRQKGGLGMGTCLSPLLAKLFMGIFERAVIDKLIKQGLVLKWYRYVDDIFCVLKTRAKDEVLRKINSWDSQLKFTHTEMSENGLIFLDCRIFYQNLKLQFIKYRKMGTKTVLSNFALSVTSKKYLKNGIFGMLHRERDCCSNSDLFKQSLEELKEVLLRNGYPQRLIDNKIKIFMSDDQKPVRPERIHTLSFNYNAFSMEPYIDNPLKK